jgi:hypothetical protein
LFRAIARDQAAQQLDVILVPRLSGRTLSDPVRAQAVSFVYSWRRFSAIFSGFIIAFLLGHYGTTGVLGSIAGAMAVVFIVLGGFGPAVTRRRLVAIAS